MYSNKPDGIYFEDELLLTKGAQSEEDADRFVEILNKKYLEQKKNTSV